MDDDAEDGEEEDGDEYEENEDGEDGDTDADRRGNGGRGSSGRYPRTTKKAMDDDDDDDVATGCWPFSWFRRRGAVAHEKERRALIQAHETQKKRSERNMVRLGAEKDAIQKEMERAVANQNITASKRVSRRLVRKLHELDRESKQLDSIEQNILDIRRAKQRTQMSALETRTAQFLGRDIAAHQAIKESKRQLGAKRLQLQQIHQSEEIYADDEEDEEAVASADVLLKREWERRHGTLPDVLKRSLAAADGGISVGAGGRRTATTTQITSAAAGDAKRGGGTPIAVEMGTIAGSAGKGGAPAGSTPAAAATAAASGLGLMTMGIGGGSGSSSNSGGGGGGGGTVADDGGGKSTPSKSAVPKLMPPPQASSAVQKDLLFAPDDGHASQSLGF